MLIINIMAFNESVHNCHIMDSLMLNTIVNILWTFKKHGYLTNYAVSCPIFNHTSGNLYLPCNANLMWIECYVDKITAQRFIRESAMCLVYICTDVYNV